MNLELANLLTPIATLLTRQYIHVDRFELLSTGVSESLRVEFSYVTPNLSPPFPKYEFIVYIYRLDNGDTQYRLTTYGIDGYCIILRSHKFLLVTLTNLMDEITQLPA